MVTDIQIQQLLNEAGDAYREYQRKMSSIEDRLRKVVIRAQNEIDTKKMDTIKNRIAKITF